MTSSMAFIPSSRVSVTLGTALSSSFGGASCPPKKRARSSFVYNPVPSTSTTITPSSPGRSRCSKHPSSRRPHSHRRGHCAMSLGDDDHTGSNAANANNVKPSSSSSSDNSTYASASNDDSVDINRRADSNRVLLTEQTPINESEDSNNTVSNMTSSSSVDVVPITIGSLSLSIPARTLLYIVPFMWGSFGPVVRFLFAQNPHQDVSIFNTERLLLSTMVYVPILFRELQALQSLPKSTPNTINSTTQPPQSSSSSSSSSETASQSQSSSQPSSSSSSSSTILNSSPPSQSVSDTTAESNTSQPLEVLCIEDDKGYTKSNRFDFFSKGIELGIIVFIANIAQVVGLQQTSASRASFLVQLQTVFVPIIGTFLGADRISAATGLSSVIAVAGVALLSSDKAAGTESSLTGDSLEVLSALFFSYYIIRLSKAANTVAPNPLVATKIAVQAVLSLVWAAGTEILQARPSAVTTIPDASWSFTTISIAVGAVVWTGLFSSALSGWLQTKGQQAVPPSEAALIFATQPLWATGLAAVTLGEKFGTRGIAGGGLIVLATLIPTLTESLPFFKGSDTEKEEQLSKDKER